MRFETKNSSSKLSQHFSSSGKQKRPVSSNAIYLPMSTEIMHRKLLLPAVLAFVSWATVGLVHAQNFKPDPWLADFAQLKREISSKYANLEWAIANRGLDLNQLSQQTETSLKQAQNEGEARKILDSFLNSFGDGHLGAEWIQSKTNIAPATESAQSSVPVPLCERVGFRSQKQPSRIDFTKLSNFREFTTKDSKYFPMGVMRVAGHKDVGVIRIPLFREYAFPDLCEQAAVELRLTPDAKCDEECEDLVGRAAANLLTEALARQVEALKSLKIRALLVDISGNGGGTNWTEPAARTFTPIPLRSPRQQFIRHEHWTRLLKQRLEVIEAEERQPDATNRKLLARGAETLRNALRASQELCDRSSIWENKEPGCTLVAAAANLYPQSVLPFAKPGILPDKPSSRLLFFPSRYAYREGVYSGQLIVLVDQGTWSSAEYFAAMLRDNEAATIIGEPTGGAGCGYTDGGIQTFLKNSGARIRVPDCVRLRADGTNEVAGITPDVLIPWRTNDSRYQRVNRVSDAVGGLLNKQTRK